MSTTALVILSIVLYVLFVVFILALCGANRLGDDEQLENEEQAQWLLEHQKKKPSFKPLLEQLPFLNKLVRRDEDSP